MAARLVDAKLNPIKNHDISRNSNVAGPFDAADCNENTERINLAELQAQTPPAQGFIDATPDTILRNLTGGASPHANPLISNA